MSKQSGRGQVAGLPKWDRCAVMGVVNVTPDSFSDGGRWFDTTAAVKRGLDLVGEGADLIDVSGGLADPRMVPAVAAAKVPFVLMHWRGFSENMNSLAVYDDVVAEVVA